MSCIGTVMVVSIVIVVILVAYVFLSFLFNDPYTNQKEGEWFIEEEENKNE